MDHDLSMYGFRSFAEMVAAIGKLTQLENSISVAIEKSRIPSSETRKFLKSSSVDQMRNVAVFQFLQNLFQDIGLGTLDVEKVSNFKLLFNVTDSRVTEIYPSTENKATCYITSDALNRFFSEDMGLPSEVSEVECKNDGSDKCRFEVNMQPLAVYQMVLDKLDREMISNIVDGKTFEEAISEKGMDQAEVEYRTKNLDRYHVIEDGRVTEIGMTYHKYGKSLFNEEEEDFPPPWIEYARISNEISDSASFAEALSETTEETHEVIDAEAITSMADEAKTSKSFAELIAKQTKEGEK